jgi:hypothetical protein
VIEREENQGLARSIVTGVTELCAACGRAIILEDDLVLSPVFLDYMLQALDRYAGEPNVYQVSGYMFPISHAPKPETSFLPLTTTWGWATWQRAWQAFSWDVPSAREHLADPDFRRRFDLDDSYPYSTMLEQRLADQNDSWGILWWYTVFNRRGLVLYPRLSLVQNLGFDGSGVHCGTSNQDVSQAVVPDRLLPPFTFPDAVEMDEEVFERVKAYMRALQPAQLPPKASFVTRIGHRMKRLIS